MSTVNDSLLATTVAQHLSLLGVEVDASGGSRLRARVPVRTGVLDAVVELHETDGAVAPPRASEVPVIVAQRHIPTGLGRRYRQSDVCYIDSGGNAWLTFPGFVVHVQGCSPAYELRPGRERPSRAFRPAGLRVVFALLTRPQLLSATVREIAAASTVSVGAGQAALRDLEAEGFLHKGRQPDIRVLSDRSRLLKRWVPGYVTELRPRLLEVDLVGPPPTWWMDHHARGVAGDGQIGGEAALAILGYGLRPLITTLYGDEPWHDIRRAGRLTRGAPSNVTLRQRFWSPDVEGREPLVPRLLIYADAVASDDPRQLEVAEAMRRDDEELRRLSDGG